MALSFVIIGGGPGGHAAASHAAKLGADVTIIERDIIGGAAHLWDCIPSKAMIATGSALHMIDRSEDMGLTDVKAHLHLGALRDRIPSIEERLTSSVPTLLERPEVQAHSVQCRLPGTLHHLATTT